MWVLARYEITALFSLKMSTATASGAKSLLVPTPYAIKMALLDAACRTCGVDEARSLWPTIRAARVALDPPQGAVVTNLFAKVLKVRRNPAAEGSTDVGPFQRTIAFREYVQHIGPLGIALQAPADIARRLCDLLMQVSYLGKRGSLAQLLDVPTMAGTLPDSYLPVDEAQSEFDLGGVLQPLDDCAPSLTFEKASIYSRERVTVGKERVIRPIVLPYRVVRSSKSYTVYERC